MSEAITGRAGAMAARIETAATEAGTGPAAAAAVVAAFLAAMRPRRERLDDEHDPDFLHPGRTVLILLEDLGITDPAVLAAGALTETLRPELAPRPGDVTAAAPDAQQLLAEIPVPATAGDELLERLVAAPLAVRCIALAERLDHARHLHLRPAAEWAPLHHETCTIYRPVAERTHPVLARRFRWWCETFRRRFLQT